MSPVTSFPVENWKDHVPGPQLVVPRLQPAWKNDVRKIKLWVYSLMQLGYVECKDEYKISKWLLLQFVCSAAMLQTVGDRLYVVFLILRFLHFTCITFGEICDTVTRLMLPLMRFIAKSSSWQLRRYPAKLTTGFSFRAQIMERNITASPYAKTWILTCRLVR